MKNNNEYSAQIALRRSDRSAKTLSKVNMELPLISSESWQTITNGFENGAKGFDIIGGMAQVSKNRYAAAVAAAAAATAAAAEAAALVTKQLAEQARQQEIKVQAERKRQQRIQQERARVRERLERAERDHYERMERGQYRDPPSRERMAEIGRMA